MHVPLRVTSSFFFFFNDPATTEIYTLSLHDALPIFSNWRGRSNWKFKMTGMLLPHSAFCNSAVAKGGSRSEEHTSELQSLRHLVCRLLLEKKKKCKGSGCWVSVRISFERVSEWR